jgi:hypothetical protein
MFLGNVITGGKKGGYPTIVVKRGVKAAINLETGHCKFNLNISCQYRNLPKMLDFKWIS